MLINEIVTSLQFTAVPKERRNEVAQKAVDLAIRDLIGDRAYEISRILALEFKAETAELQWPAVACQCYDKLKANTCVCGREEAALRAWANGNLTEPMTAAQREYCLNEIAKVEGYNRKDYEFAGCKLLARTVLTAWTDYCKDKGLL